MLNWRGFRGCFEEGKNASNFPKGGPKDPQAKAKRWGSSGKAEALGLMAQAWANYGARGQGS